MKNQTMIRLICICLCLALALSLFAGCKRKTSDTVSSSSFISDLKPLEDESSNEETIDDASSSEEEATDDTYSQEDEYISGTESEDDSSMGGDSVSDNEEQDEPEENYDDYYEEVFYQNLKVYNSKYTNENFLGINFIHQLSNRYPDMYDRVYDQKQMDQELDTMQKMGVKMVRTYYGSSLAWDPIRKTHDFESEWTVDKEAT